MLNLSTLLVGALYETAFPLQGLYITLCTIIIVAILLLSVLSIIFVLMQPSNSDGINSITGSSETFFGKNKGKSIEARLKKWTAICLCVIGVLAVIFFILQIEAIWIH